ncbi:MAG: TRAP transporter small permease [Pseudomonadota bacterium]
MADRVAGPQRLLGWVDKISNLLAVVGGIATVALVGVTVVAVFYRYVLNDPLFGVNDISTMLLTVCVAGSICYGSRVGANVYVDVLGMVGGRKVTRYTDIVVRALGAVVVALTAYALYEQSLCGAMCGYFTPNLAISQQPFYWFMVAGMATYAVILVLELIVGIVHIGDPKDPNEHD